MTEPVSLWQFIPLSQFSRPEEPTPAVVRSWSKELWHRLSQFGQSAMADEPDEEPELELHSAPLALLDRAATEPAWAEHGAAALAEKLTDWVEAQANRVGARVIVGAPGSATAAMVTRWAQDMEIPVMAPPTPEQILDDDSDWPDTYLDASVTRLVLPNLELCFLRHHRGLRLLRRFLDRLWNSEVACMVGCTSWAWSYLCRVAQADAFFQTPLTQGPFDADALDRWFRELSGNNRAAPFTFRQADNGKSVLTGADPVDNQFLTHLAARSRGNPSVAWAIWRANLQVETSLDVEEKAQEVAEEDRGDTIYLRPWDKVELPRLSADAGTCEAFILHAILLHGGLSDGLLTRLLPLTAGEIADALQRMARAGLLVEKEGRWQVTLLGYPSIRAFLARDGFLADGL